MEMMLIVSVSILCVKEKKYVCKMMTLHDNELSINTTKLRVHDSQLASDQKNLIS